MKAIAEQAKSALNDTSNGERKTPKLKRKTIHSVSSTKINKDLKSEEVFVGT